MRFKYVEEYPGFRNVTQMMEAQMAAMKTEKMTWMIRTLLAFLLFLLTGIGMSASAQAQSDERLCMERCSETCNLTVKVVTLTDPLGALVCSCLDDGSMVIAIMRRLNGTWTVVKPPSSACNGTKKPKEPEPERKSGDLGSGGTRIPDPVQPQPPIQPPKAVRGARFDAFLGVGINACMRSGDAKCDKLSPSVGLMLAPGVRIIDQIGLYLDVAYDKLATDGELTDWSSLSIMPTLRFFQALSFGEIYASAGMGHTSIWADTDSEYGTVNASWSGWTNARFGIGMLFNVTRELMFGLDLAYMLNADDTGEVCAELNGVEKCENNDNDLQDYLQVLATLKVSF